MSPGFKFSISYSTDDWDVLGRTILGEARNQSLEGQIAVAWTVRNRLSRPTRFGKSIREICLAASQYSCWNRNDPNCAYIEKARISSPEFLRALYISAQVILGDIEDPTFGSTHYVNLKVATPYWAKNKKPAVVIGAHTFYNNVL